jgi:hypothetical protein
MTVIAVPRASGRGGVRPRVVGRFFFFPFFAYVLKKIAGLPPHSTTIIAITKFLISIVNLRLAVL